MNKNILIGSLIIGFFCVGGLAGYLITDLTSEDYDALLVDFQELNAEFDELLNNYNIISGNYNDTMDEYDNLIADYNNLEGDYNNLYDLYVELSGLYSVLQQYYIGLTEVISQMVLPVQYMVFAEAVRRYYFENYYMELATDTSTLWYQFARFCRDIVLHDSQSYFWPPETPFVDAPLEGYWFPEVSNAFSDCLKYGNRTEFLARDIMKNVYYDWLPNWDSVLLGSELYWISEMVQWCIDKIDYENDTEITVGQKTPLWDYIKFPVETAFRTMGDCEDQTMLCAAYLESCGFETALGIFHDAENNDFFHATVLVHIEDTTAYYNTYPAALWSLGSYDPYEGYTWCWMDTTWDTPFGTNPGWMQYYIDNGITLDDVTFAICDLDGAISL